MKYCSGEIVNGPHGQIRENMHSVMYLLPPEWLEYRTASRSFTLREFVDIVRKRRRFPRL